MYHNNTLIHIDLRAEALRARRYLHPAVDETRPRGGCRSASGSDSHKVETDAGPTVRAWFMCVSSEETPADQRRLIPLELAHLRLATRRSPVRGPHPQLMMATGQIAIGEET